MEFNIKEIVKDNVAKFSYLRGENAYYTVTLTHPKTEEQKVYMFPVSLKDLGGASIFAEMKAITLMRYIRKAIADCTFVPTKDKPRRRFKITYRNGGYYVSIPNYDGGEVVEV
jgi:hypothetical protein